MSGNIEKFSCTGCMFFPCGGVPDGPVVSRLAYFHGFGLMGSHFSCRCGCVNVVVNDVLALEFPSSCVVFVEVVDAYGVSIVLVRRL